MKVPVIVIAYRRPDCLSRLLTSLPTDRKVYICIDGPKEHPDATFQRDYESTLAIAHNYYAEHPELVALNIRSINLGGPIGIPTFISEVFRHEKNLIILEDDCIPSVNAFDYIDNMISVLTDDTHICGISLTRLCGAHPFIRDKATLTRLPIAWGWATSRDHWENIHPLKNIASKLSDNNSRVDLDALISFVFPYDPLVRVHWLNTLRPLWLGRRFNWDYSLLLELWKRNMYFLCPPYNMVKNIGCDTRAVNHKHRTRLHMLAYKSSASLESKNYAANIKRSYSYCDYDAWVHYLRLPGWKTLLTSFAKRVFRRAYRNA